MSQAWSQWQGQIIDGKFHLQQQLGASGESALFIAQHQPASGTSGTLETVAIRLIADCSNPELQLSRWRMVQGLSHPNLLRLLDTGRCRLGDIDLIYAVMEYAEENLAQIIPERALTAEEARQMLDPALDALVYLHDKGLVYGHLKPANIMAMRDQVKLSSDCICPADDQSAAAADVWSLGVTLAEVLTQHLPAFQENADPLLPQGLPSEFVEIVRGCLRQDLRLRWTIPAIRERLDAPIVGPATSVFETGTARPPVSPVEVAPTFGEALRPKPVASQRPAPLARAAAAAVPSTVAAGNAAIVAPEARSSAVAPEPQIAVSISTTAPLLIVQGSEHAEATVKIQPGSGSPRRPGLGDEGVEVTTEHRALAPVLAMPGRALLATAIAQAKPFARRTISQTRVATQRLGSLASRASLFVAAEVEQALRRLPAHRMQRAALSGLIVFAAATALYFTFTLFHHKPVRESARTKTPAPAVVIVNQPQRPSPKKHSPAKPSPGKTQSQGQAAPQVPEPRASAQPISETRTQAAPQAPAAQNVALRSQTREGVRQIDDGGAEDDAANQSPTTKTSGSAARASSASAGGIQQVLPQVSQSALHTIRGTVRVSVRVKVDPSGNVARAELANAGPSRYFARKSLEAAQNWKFASGAGAPFLVHFEFTHSGTHAFATRVGS